MPERAGGVPSPTSAKAAAESLVAVARVRVTRGEREIAGEGTLHADATEVRIIVGRQLVRAPYERLSGMSYEPARLVLHAVGGGIVVAEGSGDLAPVAEVIERHAAALPELTRALRAFGSARSAGGDAVHDAFFAALLDARRRVEEAVGLEARLAQFDGPALRLAIEQSVASLASGRHPSSAPYRRALEAVLLDAAEPLFDALALLGTAASAVRAAGPAERFAAWRAWAAVARRAFEGADRAWATASHEPAVTTGATAASGPRTHAPGR